MKRILFALLFLACSAANAQFVTGQILTAAQLNAAFANVLATSGGTLTGPLTVQGSTTLANLTVNGTFTVPGGFSPGSLSPQAANSLLGNVSGATAAPSPVAVPSCSASGNALKWTSASGFTCGTGNALTANPLSQFAATTSAQLAGIVSDESGSGSLLFGTSPTIATPAITGGTISGTPISGSTGAFTTLSASGTVSGAGFSTYLASPPSIGNTAPGAISSSGGALNGTLGATTPSTVSATTIAASGLISPASTVGIKGTAAADSAQAGSWGEYQTFSTAAASATSFTALNATSTGTPLSAGDWDIQCEALFTAAGSTVMQLAAVGVNTTATPTIGAFGTYTQVGGTTTAGFAQVLASPVVRESFSTATTVYCPATAGFTVSTLTIAGLMRVRRVR